ncbi:hypothetical protein CK203_060068 [Vitis vinifera]|uniref:Uncharacterized protein n=1 Tax=Vitis vinifera TaxID=29760 RepID=A0A438GK46_VITVI|nr:hypothetical protein CK203_060068 [Vitis vinifera]
MVVKMMRWRPWPPLIPRKYEVKLVVRRMEGWGARGGGRRGAESGGGDQVEGAQDLAEFAETDGEEELHEGGGRGPRRRRSLG